MTGESVAEEPVNEIPLEQSVKEAPLDQQPVNKIPIDEPSINESLDKPPNQVSVANNVGHADSDEVERESLVGKRGREVEGNQEVRDYAVIDDKAEGEKPAALDSADSKDGKENYEPVEEESTLPQKPIKRARTGYFIFADEKRAEIQAKVCAKLNLSYLWCSCELTVL
jgi:hypothetical protein